MSTPLQGDRPHALAILSFQGGPRYREELPVPAPVVSIGRGAQCDVVLADDSVSDQHARLEFDAGRWRLTDLDSTNGTAVEGVKLAANVPTPVHYGVSIRFGGVTLLFREVEEADPEAARAAYVPAAPATTLKEERTRARFPVWLVALVLLVAAVLVALLVMRGGVTAQPHPAALPAAHSAAPARAAP